MTAPVGHYVTGTGFVIDPWSNWNQTYTTVSTTNVWYPAATVWGNWNNEIRNDESFLVTHQPVQLTEEQIAEQQRQAREGLVQRERARETSFALLRRHLTLRQRRDMDEHHYFELISDKGRRWRIVTNAGTSGNVRLLHDESGEEIGRYCAHPGDNLPHFDHILAQKLTLESNEEEFILTANVHWIRTGWRIPTRDNPHRVVHREAA